MVKVEPAIVAAQLREAVSDLCIRGMNQARKFAAELVFGMGQVAYRRLSHELREDIGTEDEPEN